MSSDLLRTLLVVAALLAPAAAQAGNRLTKDEALALAFPGCEVERTRTTLTLEQRQAAARAAGAAVPRAMVFAYVARKAGKRVGTAYFDAHAVRTKREVLMVVVTPQRTLARVEVVAFAEPPEYLPGEAFYAQFQGKALGPELSTKRGIRPVTGATLTVRATTEAARRVLALHQVLHPPEPPKPEPPKPPERKGAR